MNALEKAGRYEIFGELGRGAMGVVYKASDPVIGRTVAVKTIRLSEEGTGLSRPELLSRFQTEARAAGLLTHPNIVVVFDAGEEDGLYYITMELVEGKSLQAVLDSQQTFALSRTLRIMEQTCSALQFAHERNIIHRDIKPANLMLTADDTVKITDFGTAKILQFGTVQQTAHVMGTPSYMSPEQVKGRPVDGRSDIFSLGVMLYEMITGEKPFPGQNITTVIYKIVNEEPVPPRQIDPSIHPGLNAIILRALAKDPEQRYQSCREMLEDLKDYRNLGVPKAGSTQVIGGAESPNSTVAMDPAGRTSRSDDPRTASAARSLAARTSSPGQTPVLRKTGSLPAYEEPKKSSPVATVFLALLLLGVIVYGGYKVRPAFQASQQARNAATPASQPSSPIAENPVTSTPVSIADSAETKSARVPDAAAKEEPGILVPVKTPEVKAPALKAEKATPAKSESAMTDSAAKFKGRIEEAAAEKGMSDRVKVQGVANTLTVSGQLRASEQAEMLKFLHTAPAGVHVVDHFENDDRPLPAESKPATPAPVSAAPAGPLPGRGAIRVSANVTGASAVLRSNGHVVDQCQVPCTLNNLFPEQYSIEVRKDGYQSMQTALQVRAGKIVDQSARLESVGLGLVISTTPPGASVFINGDKQSGVTPVTLPLAPGEYNLVLRLEGYEAYSGHVQVKPNVQTALNMELSSRNEGHVAWANIETSPAGAEIFVDGTPTGRSTPARVQIQAGLHTIVLRHEGFVAAKRTVDVSVGGTVSIQQELQKK